MIIKTLIRLVFVIYFSGIFGLAGYWDYQDHQARSKSASHHITQETP